MLIIIIEFITVIIELVDMCYNIFFFDLLHMEVR